MKGRINPTRGKNEIVKTLAQTDAHTRGLLKTPRQIGVRAREREKEREKERKENSARKIEREGARVARRGFPYRATDSSARR